MEADDPSLCSAKWPVHRGRVSFFAKIDSFPSGLIVLHLLLIRLVVYALPRQVSISLWARDETLCLAYVAHHGTHRTFFPLTAWNCSSVSRDRHHSTYQSFQVALVGVVVSLSYLSLPQMVLKLLTRRMADWLLHCYPIDQIKDAQQCHRPSGAVLSPVRLHSPYAL